MNTPGFTAEQSIGKNLADSYKKAYLFPHKARGLEVLPAARIDRTSVRNCRELGGGRGKRFCGCDLTNPPDAGPSQIIVDCGDLDGSGIPYTPLATSRHPWWWDYAWLTVSA